MRYLILVLAFLLFAVPAMAVNDDTDTLTVTVDIDSFFELYFTDASDVDLTGFSFLFDTTSELSLGIVDLGTAKAHWMTNDDTYDTVTAGWTPGTNWNSEWTILLDDAAVASYSHTCTPPGTGTFNVNVDLDDSDNFWDVDPDLQYTGTLLFTLGAG